MKGSSALGDRGSDELEASSLAAGLPNTGNSSNDNHKNRMSMLVFFTLLHIQTTSIVGTFFGVTTKTISEHLQSKSFLLLLTLLLNLLLTLPTVDDQGSGHFGR